MHKITKVIEPLISVGGLRELQNSQDHSLVILDCSWHLPTANRDPQQEYAEAHIPGARFFDIDAVSDPNSSLPHMLPSTSIFETAVRDLGVTASSHIVVYDTLGLVSAARVWWMFRIFGHDKVQVLDGGMPAWIDAGEGITSNKETDKEHGHDASDVADSGSIFSAVLDPLRVVDKNDVQQAISEDHVLILDARSQARFDGEAAEPRPGLASGHIAGSICLPFTQLLDNGHLRETAELQQLFASIGIAPEKISSGRQTVITTCGSGVTAAVITLALELAGFGLQRLYDGSWSEWGL